MEEKGGGAGVGGGRSIGRQGSLQSTERCLALSIVPALLGTRLDIKHFQIHKRRAEMRNTFGLLIEAIDDFLLLRLIPLTR